MDSEFYPGALMGHSYAVAPGLRVRLRLARATDAAGICRLAARAGAAPPEELDVARLVRFDPARRAVICATALIDLTETVLGVGAITLDGAGHPEPDIMLVDATLGDGVGELLRGALIARAEAVTRARAA